MDYERLDSLKKKEMIEIIDIYYKSVKRLIPPNFKEYSTQELRKTIILFQIKI
jgi:hypothetical protein